MGQIRGWMLKQKIISGRDPNTVWENRGVRKCSGKPRRCYHVGEGNSVVVEKHNNLWIAVITKPNKKDTRLIKDISRTKVEKRCRAFMKKHPYGVK